MIARSAQSLRRRASTTSARVAIAAAAAVAAITLAPVASHADTPTTVTVVGTSDVFDSGLIQNVIEPGFEAAYPQYTLNYVSQGTGAAIAYAEAGTASALLVHAASLENQFVAGGFSAEQYGRAIFYGDYVLLGPKSDPAGVLTNGQPSHDIVKAFQKIAAAGGQSQANFVSRGGTPGTTVQEHAIWALTTGVTTCPVSSASGGGAVPDQNGGSSCTTPGPMPPAWYHTTGLTQGPNIVAGDACNFPSDNKNCYVFTDRGTYQFLKSEGAISNLQVVANNNATNAIGGPDLLINSFHAYAVNPNAAAFAGNSNVQINLPGATAFLDWLTSRAGQKAVTAYQPSDPSFIGDARPAITASALPATVKSGKKLTVTGTLSNVVPGTPPLAGVQMELSAKIAGSSTATTVATTTTTASGKYTLSYTPTANARSYTVSSPAISQVENATLNPIFGDLLQANSLNLGSSTVTGVPTITKLSAKKGVVKVKGTLSPTVKGSAATLRLYAGRAGSDTMRFVDSQALKNGAKSFTMKVELRRGVTWNIKVKYVNSGQIASGTSGTRSVHVH
jgi:tungstate transport system substrate-binding protein